MMVMVGCLIHQNAPSYPQGHAIYDEMLQGQFLINSWYIL